MSATAADPEIGTENPEPAAAAPARRRYRGLSAPDRARARRTALLEAGIAVFGEQGYRRATIRAVCERAGLTERYFYESFRGAEALLTEAFLLVNRRLLDEIAAAAALAPAGPGRPTEAGLDRYFRALAASPALARLFLIEASGVSAETERAEAEALSWFADALLERFDPGSLRRRPEDRLLAQAVVGGINRLARGWVASGYVQPVATMVAISLRLCLVLREIGQRTG